MDHALKLIALDRDDIEVISAHLQDAVLRVGDIHWLARENRLVVVADRFDWETAVCNNPEWLRRRSALRFDRVLACKAKQIDASDKEGVLNLLAVEFAENDPPGGAIILHFSNGAALRLDVECLECELADLGPAWKVAACPQHSEVEDAPVQQQQASRG